MRFRFERIRYKLGQAVKRRAGRTGTVAEPHLPNRKGRARTERRARPTAGWNFQRQGPDTKTQGNDGLQTRL